MRRLRRAFLLAGLAAGLAAVTAEAQPEPEAFSAYGPPDAATVLTVRGTTDIALFESVLAAFSAEVPHLRVVYEQWGSNDLYSVAAQACATGMSGADLLISSAIDQQVKLANDGCAKSHRSALTAQLPAARNWRDEVFGITSEPAVIVYNRTLVSDAEAPRSRFDLIDLLRPENSRFQGNVATYDIQVSGLGYLFAFADSQQATTFGSLIEAFGRSGAEATCCSAEIIDGVASGRYLIAYNVLGSYALARAEDNPDIAIVAPDDYTLVLSRAALIPSGASQAALAGRLIDFLLSERGRAALRRSRLIVEFGADGGPALQLPADIEASLRQVPLSPVLLVGLDQHKRQQFLDLWRATFPD
jgi:ABC-type Fe3+ transport system substrate-binding protein